jgi:hypothetical protein
MTEELVVDSFQEFHSVVHRPDSYGTLYRGQKDIQWPLRPKIGRYIEKFEANGLGKADLEKAESALMRIFRKQSAYHLGFLPKDGWQVWSIAQHHGLPTRLLDWTHSPLVALFFAVEKPFDGDSVVYALKAREGHVSIDAEELKRSAEGEIVGGTHPMYIRGMLNDKQKSSESAFVMAYEPSHETPRVRTQSAMFTAQEDPTIPLDDHVLPGNLLSVGDAGNLWRIRIRAAARTPIRHVLFNYGITRKTLFPELDGLADWITYMKLISPFEPR